MKIIIFSILLLGILQTSFLFSQKCQKTELTSRDFDFREQSPHIETGWYQEWLNYTGGEKILPDSLAGQEKLAHKFFKSGFSGAMHEDTRSTDVSNFRGPLPWNTKSQYFHVLEKKVFESLTIKISKLYFIEAY